MGKEKLAGLLRAEGFAIEVHDDHFRPDAEDEVWLEACGTRKWIAITPDTHILKDHAKMRVIGTHNARVFFLSSNNATSEVWAQAIISSRKQIVNVLNNHTAPFVARIYPTGGVWKIQELTRMGREKKHVHK